MFRRVKDHHNLLNIFVISEKETCVRQVVLDKRLPLSTSRREAAAGAPRGPLS